MDTSKLIMYALVHDLVEVYTDDFDPYVNADDPNYESKKQAIELEAQELIESDLQSAPSILNMLQAYEAREDEESRLIYTIDKIIGQLGVTEIDNRSLEDCGISEKTFLKTESKISKHQWSRELFDDIKKLYSSRESFFAEHDFVPDYKKFKKKL